MAKVKKTTSPKSLKKTGKYDINGKLDMTFEKAIKKAANTPIKKRPNKKQ